MDRQQLIKGTSSSIRAQTALAHPPKGVVSEGFWKHLNHSKHDLGSNLFGGLSHGITKLTKGYKYPSWEHFQAMTKID